MPKEVLIDDLKMYAKINLKQIVNIYNSKFLLYYIRLVSNKLLFHIVKCKVMLFILKSSQNKYNYYIVNTTIV